MRIATQFEGGVHTELQEINGQTGLVIRSNAGIVAVALMHIENNLIQHIYFVRNPDKLGLKCLW